MKSRNLLKQYLSILGQEELVDFLMWSIEYDIDLDNVQGDVISLYRQHQYSMASVA